MKYSIVFSKLQDIGVILEGWIIKYCSPLVVAFCESLLFILKGSLCGDFRFKYSILKAAERLHRRGGSYAAALLFRFLGCDVHAYPNRGVLYAQLLLDNGDYKRARKYIDESLQKKPLAGIFAAQIRYEYLQGRLQKARETLNGFDADSFEFSSVLDVVWICRMYLLFRDFAPAEAILRNGLSQFPEKDKEVLTLELAKLLRDTGRYSKALTVIESALFSKSYVDSVRQQLMDLGEIVHGELKVYDMGERPALVTVEKIEREERKGIDVLHLLEASLPHKKSGYTYRSHSILTTQKKLGLSVEAFSSPGSSGVGKGEKRVKVDGVTYRSSYLPMSSNYRHYPLNMFLNLYCESANRVVEKTQPRFLHAASNFKNGLVAAELSREYDIPWIYELRGLWHETQVALGVITEESERYKNFQKMEAECFRNAHMIVTLSEQLKRHISECAEVPEDKIKVIPNGVDCESFSPSGKKDQKLLHSLGLQDKKIVGYIGSLNDYEGLDIAIEAFARVRHDIPNSVFLIVGDGQAMSVLKDMVSERELEDSVLFIGRVPQLNVSKYIELLDLFLLPRKSHRVCQLVPPLKPLEVMSMKVPVLASNLPVLEELISDRKTGFLFKSEDVSDLAENIIFLLKNSKLRASVSENGHQWVVENRDWAKLASEYNDVYYYAAENILAKNRASCGSR